MHFKKSRDILIRKNSEIGFSLLCCLKQIVLFGSQCISWHNLLQFESQSTSYQKAVKWPQKRHKYLQLSLEKKNSQSITLTLTNVR